MNIELIMKSIKITGSILAGISTMYEAANSKDKILNKVTKTCDRIDKVIDKKK